ncbi:CbtA family protein [Candidatus Nitrososphaera sp. FF02]|uniref:CbtA family protein n=1 Tax=Candidatus Nitrososphaera sp. FF02 TaxID=3398226 RepID=UPI0039ED693B
MKAVTFIAISLLSGAIAGTILALINQAAVEPFIEQAIQLEVRAAEAEGEIIDPVELRAYRDWQLGGSVATGAIMGLSYGALFGIVYAYARKGLPGKTEVAKAMVLAGMMWFVLYMVVAVKYPANPPAVGDPVTIYLRQTLYIAMIAISGLAAVGSALVYRKMGAKSQRKAVAIAVYAGITIVAFFALPANPDAVTAPENLVNSFRIASAATMTVFWVLLGGILGAMWGRTKPHETAKIAL